MHKTATFTQSEDVWSGGEVVEVAIGDEAAPEYFKIGPFADSSVAIANVMEIAAMLESFGVSVRPLQIHRGEAGV